jgi:SAM-dependent methyltransferase
MTRTLETQQRFYWEYEYEVAKRYMIPLLAQWGITMQGRNVIDVGCGEGGGVCAMHDAGARVDGFDLMEHRVHSALELQDDRGISFRVGDLYSDDSPFPPGGYDLVVLHDVFEHLDRKPEMLTKLMSFAREDGVVMITYPPYFSGYGGHQQMLKTWYARLPFMHLFPGFSNRWLPRLRDEHLTFVQEVQKLSQLKMGMSGFERIVQNAGFEVVGYESYLVSPNHIRFGLKPIKAGLFGRVPGIREVACSGVAYLVRRRRSA